MQQASRIFNRQVIRLCKGILKAWEQWVDEIECENPANNGELEMQGSRKKIEDPK
jgi:hypothetical protein